MEFEENKLTVMLDDGTEVECVILFTFESDEFNANYVVYFPADQVDADEIDLRVSKYVEDGDTSGQLIQIDEDADDEWEMIEAAIAEYEREYEEGME